MTGLRNIDTIKKIAIAANDDKNNDLIEWSYFNKALLKEHEIIAPEKEANILEGTINKTIHKLLNGTSGGYEQLGNMIRKGEVDILIFFWNPVETQLQNNYVKALLRMALSSNIIIANNRTTADFILHSVLMTKQHSIPVLEEAKPSAANVSVIV